jgi:hypothetical protein
MTKKKQPIGMPSQCVETGEALIKVYGEERALKFIDSNIDSIREILALVPTSKDTVKLKLKIALQSDFWSQVKDSI